MVIYLVTQYAFHPGSMWDAYGTVIWKLYGTHADSIWNSHMETIWNPCGSYMTWSYRNHMGCRVQTTSMPICSPDGVSIWSPYGGHMTLLLGKILLVPFFPDTVYRAHCAVIFAIAQLSCFPFYRFTILPFPFLPVSLFTVSLLPFSHFTVSFFTGFPFYRFPIYRYPIYRFRFYRFRYYRNSYIVITNDRNLWM